MMSPEMQKDFERWQARRAERDAAITSLGAPTGTFEEAKAQLLKITQQLPESVEIPYAETPEGARYAKFQNICPDEFKKPIERSKLANPAAFDAICGWDGSSPGPLAVGPTGTSKSRAVWTALERLWVKQGMTFAWFPVRKLISEMAKAEDDGYPDGFYRGYSHYQIWFVDDIDKVNLQFQSQVSALWEFSDYCYRHQKRLIATTNRDRAWWEENLGSTLTRRLFVDGCRPVQF